MRSQTKEYVLKSLETITPTKALEVGSLDVNGHLREIFTKKKIEYIGIDMREGENVDVVVNGHDLLTKFKEEEFDFVMCFDTFEHDDAFWLTLEQMKKVLKPGGWMLLGFPSRACPEHDHPHDYWRFMPQSVDLMFKGFDNVSSKIDRVGDVEDEIYSKGQKP